MWGVIGNDSKERSNRGMCQGGGEIFHGKDAKDQPFAGAREPDKAGSRSKSLGSDCSIRLPFNTS
jgi:hypothetical protein